MSLAWTWLAIAALCNTGGNYLLKLASREGERSWVVIPDPLTRGGIGFLVLGLFFYTRALVALPLAVAYPFLVGISMVTATLVGAFLLGETVNRYHTLGIAMIVVGSVFLTVCSQRLP